MKKIEKMVKAYNDYAKKRNYDVIKVDYENKKVIGDFTPKNENSYSGFFGYFKNVMIAGHNASLKADLEKIKEELNKL